MPIGRRWAVSRQVQLACTAYCIGLEKISEQTIKNSVRVFTAGLDGPNIGDRKDGLTACRIPGPDCGFQRRRTLFIAIVGQKQEAAVLTALPDGVN
jgi:hypothetical protein